MPTISPARTVKIDAVERELVALVERLQALGVEQRLARRRVPLLHLEAHLPADHHLGELRFGGGLRIALADDLAAAQHADAVGDLEHLAQLVGDEDERLAGVAERADDAEELGDLLRRQHRRRLVEDQHVGGAEEHLQDLDALLRADRDLLDDRVGVDLEAVLGADLAHLLARLRHVEMVERAGRLDAEHDVLRHGEDRHQHEMLMHHADAGVDGVLGAVEVGRLAVDEDFALVRAVEPGEDVHQRGLAGAVFAEQAENLSGPDIKVDVGVCDDLAEALGDAA